MIVIDRPYLAAHYRGLNESLPMDVAEVSSGADIVQYKANTITDLEQQ